METAIDNGTCGAKNDGSLAIGRDDTIGSPSMMWAMICSTNDRSKFTQLRYVLF